MSLPDFAKNGATGSLYTLFGFAAGWIGDFFRDKRVGKREQAASEATLAREREARRAMARIQLQERRVNFQRETLLALQDAIVKLARAAGRIDHLDKMEQRRTQTWQKYLLPEGLSDDVLAVNNIILILTPRVRDDKIREMVDAFRTFVSHVGIAPEDRQHEAMAAMAAVLPRLHDRIGEVLRKLDDEEEALLQ